MSEVSELIPTPASDADGVDRAGDTGRDAPLPQFRPVLPPRPSKTTTPSAAGSGVASASPSAVGDATAGPTAEPVLVDGAQTRTATEATPAPVVPAASTSPVLLTAPPLVAPPLVAPPSGPPVVAAPIAPAPRTEADAPDGADGADGSTRPNGDAPAWLPPPPSASVAADLPAPSPAATNAASVPGLPTLGLAPVAPGLAALRLNLEPIEDVAARAAAYADHDVPGSPIAAEGDAADEQGGAASVSSFTNGSALSMLSSEPATVDTGASGASGVSGTSGGPVVPTLASSRPTAAETTGDVDEAAIEDAVEDALAVAAAKSGDPHLLAAAAHFAAQKQAASLPPVKGKGSAKRQRRGRGRYVFLAFVLVAGSGAAFVFRDSPIMQKVRGVGYDPQALPGTVYERPVPGTVEVSFEVTSLQQLPTGDDVSIRTVTDLTTNPTTGEGRFDGTRTVHPIVEGVAEEDPESTQTSAMIRTATAQYRRSSTDPSGVWQSESKDPLERGVGNLVLMYQDVVDESLRRVRPVSTETVVDGADTLTTFTWTIPVGEFYESAPQLSGLTDMLDGNADPASTATVVMTVDADGVVRLLEVALELEAVLDHTTEVRAGGRDIPYHYRWELTSMSDEAFVVAVPDGVTPPADPAAVDPAAVDPAAVDPAAADPAAAAVDPAAVDPAVVPETVPATAPVAPAGG